MAPGIDQMAPGPGQMGLASDQADG
jgi:hypothetical protein